MKKIYQNTVVYISLLVLTAFISGQSFAAANSSDYTAAPPFVATSVGKPNVVIALDISGSMKAVAYRDVTAGNWSANSTVHDDFSPDGTYFGYFESDKKYTYDTNNAKLFFVENNRGEWDGNFLNWLVMRRMDVARKVLVGGKVRDRNGEVIDGDTWYVLEGQNEPADRTFHKQYRASSTVSPYPDNVVFKITEGILSVVTSSIAISLPLSDHLEMGQISIDRNQSLGDDYNQTSNWHHVDFINTYSNPVVVATALSFNGGQPAHARVRNVTSTGFEIRLEEWEYLDVNHTTEDVTFIVAEGGAGGSNTVSVGGNLYEVRAGIINTNSTASGGSINSRWQHLASSGYTPIVFAGVSSQNDDRPVIVRVDSVNTSGFNVSLQNEEDYGASGHPEIEDVHWIAIQPFKGALDHGPVSGSLATVGESGGLNVDENFRNVYFNRGYLFFNEKPIVGVVSTTLAGIDTAVPRYRNVNGYGFQAFMEEEKSKDTERGHANENIGYIAFEYTSGHKIQLGVTEEPEGVVQQNSGSMRFGLAVYNYNHTRTPTSVYNSNQLHGGTFRACYPDISLAPSSRTNFDICFDTHVKSPLSNIIDVIEDHPLIWGTTPIAETLYDIKGYFEQRNYNRNGHTQWYDNGMEGISGIAPDGNPKKRNSYEISNDWDPFYYDEFSAKLPCAKSFVLHFNDGAPYLDFDSGRGPHPNLTNDGVGNFGPQEMLDDLALMLRKNDCRTDSGMEGHQEIISYYVYAALGEDESNNGSTRKMREAAANGGFVDTDGDRLPDPRHPANFINYMSGPCTANEWDEDGDCNPDNFYFANDGQALVNELNAAFEAIVTRAATGGASSVISASRSGEGSIVNAIFRPYVSSGADNVAWTGDVHALMIDDAGRIRQDDGDAILEDSDGYLDMCNDDTANLVRARVSSSLAARPTTAQLATCSEIIFPLDLFDIEYLWSGANWLSSLSNSQVMRQRTYSSSAKERYIITGVDSNGNGMVQNSEQLVFEAGSFPESVAGLLANDLTSAHNVIKFVRGEDVVGLRSRQLEGKTLRLGDVIYSTPTIVGRPSENLDLLYESTSYRTFLRRYKNRRQVIYAGGNDGMIHAFNGGWYNAETKELKKSHGTDAGSITSYDLGAELWAYVPYNGLPHLEYLARLNYGQVSSDHLYFADLKPRIFDAKIFTADTDHPGGWGTVLMVGMRLGGGSTSVDADLDSSNVDTKNLRSSFVLFDITNPDRAPQLLLEFSHANLGFTTSIPAPITVGSDAEGNGDWYLMIGSGADTNAAGFDTVKSTQNARLFLLDLKKVASGNATVLEPSFGTAGVYTLGDSNSFISDLTAVDFGLDHFTTDAVYFGTVSGDTRGWGGKIYRVKIQEDTDSTPLAVSSWAPFEILDVTNPVTAPIAVSTDELLNRWLYVGSGRYFTSLDNIDTSDNVYVGLKEPRDTTGAYTYAAIDRSKSVNVSSVRVETDTGELDPLPTLSPVLDTDSTVADFESRIRQYSNSSEYVSAWYRDLLNGERNFGAATVLGGTLTFTTFDPIFDQCLISGNAYLYVLNSLTGTAASPAIIGQDSTSTYNQYVVDIGGSPATSPSLHRGEGYSTDNRTTAIIQTANGNILTVEQANEESVRDGEASWRQLK